MQRLLDVPSALESRGYQELSGEVIVAVDDPLFEENRGPFRVEAEAGKTRVTRTDEDAGPPIGIGALSCMFTGYLGGSDLARVGAVPENHPALHILSGLFAGPRPWMMDFF
jgi:predicted acetyltransferase